MRKAEPKFVFKRHRTPESVLRAFISPSGWKLEDVAFGAGPSDVSSVDAADGIRVQGMWGFAETKASPFKIHFWHDGKRTEDDLIRFFAHELGHCTGKKARGHLAEEHRADEYGDVASMATRLARKHSKKG